MGYPLAFFVWKVFNRVIRGVRCPGPYDFRNAFRFFTTMYAFQGFLAWPRVTIPTLFRGIGQCVCGVVFLVVVVYPGTVGVSIVASGGVVARGFTILVFDIGVGCGGALQLWGRECFEGYFAGLFVVNCIIWTIGAAGRAIGHTMGIWFLHLLAGVWGVGPRLDQTFPHSARRFLTRVGTSGLSFLLYRFIKGSAHATDGVWGRVKLFAMFFGGLWGVYHTLFVIYVLRRFVVGFDGITVRLVLAFRGPSLVPRSLGN